MHKISNEFEFQPVRTTDYGVSCPWASKKLSIDLQWENGDSMLARSFFIESSKLLVTRTGIKAWTSLISGWIRLLTFLVTCPWMTKTLHFRTLISLRPFGQSWSNFMCSITEGGEKLHHVLRQIGSNSGVHGNRKPPLTYNGENGVSVFSIAFDPILFSLPVRSTRRAIVVALVVRGCFLVTLRQSFICKFFKSLDSHSESIHIWTIDTLEGQFSFHNSWPQDWCPRVGLEVKI